MTGVDSPRLFFDHLPKTAGTSLHALFRRIYGDTAVPPKFVNLRIHEARARHPTAKVLLGHVRLMPGDTLPPDFLSITVLRDPIDRIVSEYFYRLHDVSPVSSHGPQGLTSSGFDEFVASGGDGSIELANYQAKHFALYSGLPGTWHSEEELRDRAVAALERFDLVGLTQELQAFVDVLGWKLGWEEPVEVPVENRTSARPQLQEVDAGTLRRLRELNAADISLCEYAADRLKRALRDCVRQSYRRSVERVGVAVPHSPAPGTGPAAQGDTAVVHGPAPSEFGDRAIEIAGIALTGAISAGECLLAGESATVAIVLDCHVDCDDLTVGFHIQDDTGAVAFGTNSRLLGYELRVLAHRRYRVLFSFMNILGLGDYRLGAAAHTGYSHLNRCFHWIDQRARFRVSGNIGQGFDGRAKMFPQVSVWEELEGAPHPVSLTELPHVAQALTLLNAPLSVFAGSLKFVTPLESLAPSQCIAVEIEARNLGDMPWQASGQRPVRVSYRWIDEDGQVIVYDGERTALPQDVQPGQAVRVWATVSAPPERRPHWVLRMTLIQEWVGWFDERANTYVETLVRCATSPETLVSES